MKVETEKGFSTPDEEIIKEAKKYNNVEDAVKKALSLKEQEVSKITDEYYNWMKIATDYEKKYKELLSSYYKLQDTLLIERNNKNQFLSSLQEKIENFEDFIKFNLILTDIKDEKGNKSELSDELMKLFEIFTEQFIFPKFREIFQEKT